MEIFQLGYQQLLNQTLKRINKKWETLIIGVSHFFTFLVIVYEMFFIIYKATNET